MSTCCSKLGLVVRVPAGAIDKIEIERNLDEPHAGLYQSASEQATLTEFRAIRFAQGCGFVVQLKRFHEITAARQFQTLADGGVVIDACLFSLE